eukprot:TRINITY_DN51767_c0_g1_i1.p1 TRINITY_DN51767_c0_g1~~TRINITY_DN51767_c0_g1_i1.p1  ORF type:complete len:213 (-),score=37.08 TRINITY_DN51767_c0_g1_i1:103-741(-)
MRCGNMNLLHLLISTILIGLVDIGCCKTLLEPMRCYIGECTGNDEDKVLEECRRESMIRECPRDKPYDSCLTTINRKAYGSITVVKTCGVDPCSVAQESAAAAAAAASSTSSSKGRRGQAAHSTLDYDHDLDQCQRYQFRDSYMCAVCCHHDMCNSASSIKLFLHHKSCLLCTVTGVLLAASLLCNTNNKSITSTINSLVISLLFFFFFHYR